MRRHFARAGAATAAAALLSLFGYLTDSASTHGRHAAWPYGVFAAVMVAGVIVYLVSQDSAPAVAVTRDPSRGDGSSDRDPTLGNATTANVPEAERRRQLGRKLSDARLKAGLAQQILARQLPNRSGRLGVTVAWLDRVEQQSEPSGVSAQRAPLPQRNQLIAWATICKRDPYSLLYEAKVLLPEYYPDKFIWQPRTISLTSTGAADGSRWRTADVADPREVVDRLTSLLQEGERRDNRVELTLIGPLLLALAAQAGSRSELDPLIPALARYLEFGSEVLQLWPSGGPNSRDVDWQKRIPSLLLLNGFAGPYKALTTPQPVLSRYDIVTVRDCGGLIVLQQADGYITIPVVGDAGLAAMARHFEFLRSGQPADEFIKVFNWGPSPVELADWQNAMADADESPGWRMLIQPFVGDVTIPSAVQDRLIDKWRDEVSDGSRHDDADDYREALRRRRAGFELTLEHDECWDIVSGPAFRRFVDHGELQVTWAQETPQDRLEHLDRLLDLLARPNYHLAIVRPSDKIYVEIFGSDAGTRSDQQLYCLLKDRGNDAPSVFTSTYFADRKQSRGFELRHQQIFEAYKAQGDEVVKNLPPALWDKAILTSEIKTAISRIRSALM